MERTPLSLEFGICFSCTRRLSFDCLKTRYCSKCADCYSLFVILISSPLREKTHTHSRAWMWNTHTHFLWLYETLPRRFRKCHVDHFLISPFDEGLFWDPPLLRHSLWKTKLKWLEWMKTLNRISWLSGRYYIAWIVSRTIVKAN